MRFRENDMLSTGNPVPDEGEKMIITLLLPCYDRDQKQSGGNGIFIPSGSLFKIASVVLALPIVEMGGAMEARPAIACLHIQNKISFPK